MGERIIRSKYTVEQSKIGVENIVFHNVKEQPFSLHGFYGVYDEPGFRRLPDDIALRTSEGVQGLYRNTAGGRVRFATDSDCIAIKVRVPHLSLRPHITLLSTMGFDVYEQKDGKEQFAGCFKPPVDTINEYEGKIMFKDRSLREITINFPLYNDVDQVQIGLREDADLRQPKLYTIRKPIVYYGSSITQGACASRPGLSYEAWISRKLDCDYMNLGFAGNCKGEEAIVDHMSRLEMSCFVCDYDHNAPNVQHLQNTHANVYRKIRERQPNLPIVMISKPDIQLHSPGDVKRRKIIMETYMEAVQAGDANVYFIDGYSLFSGEDREECTVDGCHPNDIGFHRMANVIGKTLQTALRAI